MTLGMRNLLSGNPRCVLHYVFGYQRYLRNQPGRPVLA